MSQLAVIVIGIAIDEPLAIPYLKCAKAVGMLSEYLLSLPDKVGVGAWNQNLDGCNSAFVEEIAAHADFLPPSSMPCLRRLPARLIDHVQHHGSRFVGDVVAAEPAGVAAGREIADLRGRAADGAAVKFCHRGRGDSRRTTLRISVTRFSEDFDGFKFALGQCFQHPGNIEELLSRVPKLHHSAECKPVRH